MPIKRPRRPVSPIDPEVLTFAVTGETAADSFVEFGKTFEEWIAFWIEHETALREEARPLQLAAATHSAARGDVM